MTSKKKKTKKTHKANSPIVIDEGRGLVFENENAVYEHFTKEIEILEKEYRNIRTETESNLDELSDIDSHLTELLQEPDEVWLALDVLPEIPLGTFIGYYETEDEEKNFYYIALTYLDDNLPKFVFLHFATDDLNLIKKYQRGKKIYDKNNPQISSDELAVDALTEGDELAVGLYQAMLKLRTATDIPAEEFTEFLKYREETIQEPEEIWKKIDSEGRVLVSFIKSVTDDDDLKYIVVTVEDEATESHYLLFSFPTKDPGLVERYRQGESLDTVSYSREESH